MFRKILSLVTINITAVSRKKYIFSQKPDSRFCLPPSAVALEVVTADILQHSKRRHEKCCVEKKTTSRPVRRDLDGLPHVNVSHFHADDVCWLR